MSDEKNDKWEMPQPVFKSSEGSLPRSLEETISTSFMANAETIEIDEDDDILGIMDDSYLNRPAPHSAEPEDEPILETLPEMETETTPAARVAEDDPIVEDGPVADIGETQPMVVTAKEASESTAATSGDTKSNSVIYLLIALIGLAIIIALLYSRS